MAKLFLLPYVSCLAKTVSKLFLFHYGAVAKFVLLPYVSCLVLYKPTLRIILGLLFDLGSSGLEPLTLAILGILHNIQFVRFPFNFFQTNQIPNSR